MQEGCSGTMQRRRTVLTGRLHLIGKPDRARNEAFTVDPVRIPSRPAHQKLSEFGLPSRMNISGSRTKKKGGAFRHRPNSVSVRPR